MSACFVALDFETADYGRDSACAVGLVRVEDGAVVARVARLIRPPRRSFVFTHIHGITWSDVAEEPTFAPVWREMCPVVDGAEFLAAHNAPFDRSVLRTCCAKAGIAPPNLPFRCTVRMARQAWGLRPTRLPDVCAYLGLALKHHDAASDAEACARIVIAAGPSLAKRNGREPPCDVTTTRSG
ncbi:MAG: 3'-5' exonuclease [Pseudomonadota bacterium]